MPSTGAGPERELDLVPPAPPKRLLSISSKSKLAPPKWVQDYRGNNLLIFPREWSIRWALEKNKDLVLKEFHEG